ncbi:hypothetical protein BDF22DRAFT_620716 [Syncephalis plumigaleata]|nr:hypothetical protein BDF22DRAFT_620716 [Syncephalis plumigaleata]
MRGKLEFFGSIDTDGVGVTVIKKVIKKVTKEGGAKSAKEPAEESATQESTEERIRYITELDDEEHEEIKGKCVAVDPGRRDLLFCVHEKSTPDEPRKYRYTKQCQDKMRRMKKYRRIIQKCKKGNQAVLDAEAALSEIKGSAVSLEKYKDYLRCRSQHSEVLTSFYRDTFTTPITRPPATRPTTTDPITDPITESTTRPTTQPLFRKLKLSAYINKQKSDQMLIHGLTKKFGKDAVFVMGNWSAPPAKHHEPIRGKGFRRLLQQHFKVFLIDEHKTSKCCPECNKPTLETYKPVDNPRPDQRKKRSKVIRHGLLRCTHRNCKEAMKNIKDKKLDKDNKPIKKFEYRVWNRDMAACLNFIQIIRSLRKEDRIPTQFERNTVPSKRSSNHEQDQEGTKQQKTIHP